MENGEAEKDVPNEKVLTCTIWSSLEIISMSLSCTDGKPTICIECITIFSIFITFLMFCGEHYYLVLQLNYSGISI